MTSSSRTIGSVRSYVLRLRGLALVLFLAVVGLSPIVHTHGLFHSGLDPEQGAAANQTCPACVFSANAGLVPDTARLDVSLDAVALVEVHSIRFVPATFSAEIGRSPPAA